MSDRYTQIMLTIIAVALVALVAQNAVNPLNAQSNQPQRVQICDAGSRCVGVWGKKYEDGRSVYGLYTHDFN
jgi:hypothetical protein